MMAERIRMVAPPALPPLRDAFRPAAPRGRAPDAARLARLALCLAALALPALGSVAADTVHRGVSPGTQQATALPTPSGRTAAPQASRSVPVLREAALTHPHAGSIR
ncbi:hypothetical protein DK427_02905 [Methylobacterium radiodurans]|uniref:Uncharacterized protein n=1 Tax=Methylobacterium radiodurans TaxID=2202828 RepID=A0A2U8VMC3_9HYPH|nr:hypothetical protein DK427_02905 [Methylobacterium radiodurans]